MERSAQRSGSALYANAGNEERDEDERRARGVGRVSRFGGSGSAVFFFLSSSLEYFIRIRMC